MLVYMVKKGDTLRSIALAVGSTEMRLQQLNGLSGAALTVGLNLLVPGPPATLAAHRAHPKETLASIAQQHGTTAGILAAVNGLESTAPLSVGQILWTPTLVAPKRTIAANGYLIPSAAGNSRVLAESKPLSLVTVFSYHVNFDGSLTPAPDQRALSEMSALGVTPLLSVTNFDGHNFNPDLARSILSDAAKRLGVIDAIDRALELRGYHGVNIDFEHMLPTDRPLYNDFIAELHRALHPKGKSVSIALGPKTHDEPDAAWMGAFDYKALGGAVDFIMLMTYEWGWVGGPPMAVAPLDQVRAVLDYAVSVIPPEKLLMGIPTYGYDWTLPHDPNSPPATGLSPRQAQNLAVTNGVAVHFHPLSASPTFRYRSGSQDHEVWYEDAKSLLAKLHLVYQMKLRGVSFWVLGQTFPQLWALLADTFTVG